MKQQNGELLNRYIENMQHHNVEQISAISQFIKYIYKGNRMSDDDVKTCIDQMLEMINITDLTRRDVLFNMYKLGNTDEMLDYFIRLSGSSISTIFNNQIHSHQQQIDMMIADFNDNQLRINELIDNGNLIVRHSSDKSDAIITDLQNELEKYKQRYHTVYDYVQSVDKMLFEHIYKNWLMRTILENIIQQSGDGKTMMNKDTIDQIIASAKHDAVQFNDNEFVVRVKE